MEDFSVGDYITFKGSVGSFASSIEPEKTCGLIVQFGLGTVLVKILNNPAFRRGVKYFFKANDMETFVKIGRVKEYKEWKDLI